MTWETDKVWEYIQNDEDVLNELSNQTDDTIYDSLYKSDKFRQYVYELFMENVDFEELETNLKDESYSIELYFLDYCFQHELNLSFENLTKATDSITTILIGVDCGFAVYDVNGQRDSFEEKFNLQEEILSKLYCLDLKDKEMNKAIKHYANNQLSDDVDWLYDEIKDKITDGKPSKTLWLEVVLRKD